MDVVDIEVFGVQSVQCGFDLGFDDFPGEAHVVSSSGVEKHLACDDEVLAVVVGKPVPDEAFAIAIAVDVRRVEKVDFTDFPVEIALANTQGTRQLLNHARACDARLVFASTSEVYGDPEVHPQPETYTGNVDIRGIRSCYDESKRFGETLTVAYRRKYDLDTRTVRLFNAHGPRMRPDDGRVVPTFVTQALRDEDLTVYGDGEQNVLLSGKMTEEVLDNHGALPTRTLILSNTST